MRDKPTIILCSDTPAVPTGMGCAHMELASRLHATGKYKIISLGWFHRKGMPWPFPWELVVLPDKMYGHPPNWPNSSPEELEECAFNKVIREKRPDIVITISDVWMTDFIPKLPTRNTFKWIWEFPIDGEPVPKSWVRLVKNADMPIVMTKYAERVIRNVDPNIYLERMPRGVSEKFYKLPISKAEAKVKAAPSFKDRFLIGMVARFQDRKQVSRAIEAVSKFINKYKRYDALFYMHCIESDTPIIIKHNNEIDIIPISNLGNWTRNGSNEVLDLINTDYLIWDGDKFVRILYVKRQVKSGMSINFFSYNSAIGLTGEHPIFMNDGNTKIADKLQTGDSILSGQFPEIKNNTLIDKELAWAMGLFLAEGSCGRYKIKNRYSSQWHITNCNKELLDRAGKALSTFFDTEYYIEEFPYDRYSDGVIYRLQCREEVRMQSYFNMFYSKNNHAKKMKGKKKIPSFIFNIDKEAKKYFIDGYLSGDGHRYNSNSFNFTTNSAVLAQGILILANSTFPNKTFNINVENRNKKGKIYYYYHVDCNNYTKIKNRNAIKNIFKKNICDRYVYDITTESGKFQAGVGLGIVHNCDINDPASLSLSKTLVGEDGIIERYHMEDYVAYDKQLTIEKGVSPERLNLLYNAFDVQILSTQGEGWGLPLVECMSAGTPCIATGYTSIPELLEGHGKIAKVKTFVTGMYNVERALVDTDHMADLIEEYYRDPEQRMIDGLNSAKFALQFRWDTIIRLLMMHIDKLLAPKSYKLIETDNPIENPCTKINICGAVRENTGWAITTRGFAEGLDSLSKDISITEGGGRNEGYQVTDQIKSMISKPRNSDIDIINHLPDHQKSFLDASTARLKLSYFPWELTKFKDSWIDCLNRDADMYLCPSNFIKKIALEHGVNRVGVIPLAIDRDIDANAEPIKLSDNTYHFIYIGQMGDPRKNVKELIKAFFVTFTKSEKVALVLKCNPGHEDSDPTELIEFESLGIKDPPNVIVIHEELDNKQLSRLYKSCDCMVYTSHAEGWGQPILEAMRFGMPVIAPAYGGYMDFASNYIIPINYTMGNSGDSPSDIPQSQWCIPDFNNLCKAMRETFDKKLTRDGKDYVKDYTWENTAKEIEKNINIVKKQPGKIRVYFETGIHSLWNKDNEENLKRYAPPQIEFTNDYSTADIQILNVTRLADKYLILNKNYIVLAHCFGEWSEEPHEAYNDIFQKARLVYSQLDLSKHPNINFMRGPWGVNTNIFYNINPSGKRPFQITCTGSVASTEGLSEVFTTCTNMNKQMCHLGPRLFEGNNYYCPGFVDHNRLLEIYGSSLYINAMRRIEGFEKTVAEGILCGARPICFDNPIYKYWYGDLVEYVREGSHDEVIKDLTDLFNKPLRKITPEEQKLVMSKFGWIGVARKFWDRFLKDYKTWEIK